LATASEAEVSELIARANISVLLVGGGLFLEKIP
jgi:hypothetical protein